MSTKDLIITPKYLERTYGPRDHAKIGPEIDRLFKELLGCISGEVEPMVKTYASLVKVVSYDSRFEYFMQRIAPAFKAPEYELKKSPKVIMHDDLILLSLKLKDGGAEMLPDTKVVDLPLFAEIRITDIHRW